MSADGAQRANHVLGRVYQDIAGRPSKSGDGGALARGYIGEAIDDYQQQIAVVVDPHLVDMNALQVELTDAIAAAHRTDPKIGPLSIRVQAACHSASELIEARDVVQALAWHPDANAAQSLISERFDRTQARGAGGRVEAEEQAGEQ